MIETSWKRHHAVYDWPQPSFAAYQAIKCGKTFDSKSLNH